MEPKGSMDFGSLTTGVRDGKSRLRVQARDVCYGIGSCLDFDMERHDSLKVAAGRLSGLAIGRGHLAQRGV